MKIAVAVSGGMDSLCALLALREAGHEVVALHALFVDPPREGGAVPGLRSLCAKLGIALQVEDLRAAFRREVIAPFVRAHVRARTPNPCALCNRSMKFGALLDAALRPICMGGSGADAIATGHYAALKVHPVYGHTLKAGEDFSKDQSYFLALVSPERLRHCVFPLADKRKDQLRSWLEGQNHAVPVPGESQEICFVPRDDHRAFLQGTGVELPGPGPVLLRAADGSEREIARHRGLWQYTEGQRKGLGLSFPQPMYVKNIDPQRNQVVLGEERELYARALTAEDLNLTALEEISSPLRVRAKLRSRHQEQPATVVQTGPDRMRVEFDQPQRAITKGQAVVLYDGDTVVGGGVIRQVED